MYTRRRKKRRFGAPTILQFRDLRRTASKKRAKAGASEAELAAGTGHSVARSAEILNVYNPPSYALATSAQDKRRRHKKQNRGSTKV